MAIELGPKDTWALKKKAALQLDADGWLAREIAVVLGCRSQTVSGWQHDGQSDRREFYTLGQLSRFTKIHRTTITSLLDRGQLRSEVLEDGTIVVSAQELEQLRLRSRSLSRRQLVLQ